MEVDVEFFRESGWGPWVAFLFVAIAFYFIWELMIAIRSWRSRRLGPWSNAPSKSTSRVDHRAPEHSLGGTSPVAPQTQPTTEAVAGKPERTASEDAALSETEPSVAKSEADLARMDAIRRRKQREHRLNIKDKER